MRAGSPGSIADLDAADQRSQLIETGYVMPHWPKPWGREAGAVEQLVVEQEFASAGVQRPTYGITGWVILTLVQHATEDQVKRWVAPALRQDVIWCQLFSEPDAGTDLAGLKTAGAARRRWLVIDGQKVWTTTPSTPTSGFATVPHHPDAPKHQGITTVVLDMSSPRASRCDPLESSPATPTSTRCSSTTCSCPTTTSSAP